jgi:hypothetical protein
MKNQTLTLGSLAIAALLAAGCNKNQTTEEYPTTGTNSSAVARGMENAKEATTNAWEKTKEVTTNMMADVKEGTTNAWADIKDSVQSAADYSYDKKNEFVANASADVDTLDQKMNELSNHVANSSESVKTDAQAKLQELDAKRAELGAKLDDVKNATETNWDEVKTGFENSYHDLKNSLKQAWQ